MSQQKIFGPIAETNIGWSHLQETANGTGSRVYVAEVRN